MRGCGRDSEAQAQADATQPMFSRCTVPRKIDIMADLADTLITQHIMI